MALLSVWGILLVVLGHSGMAEPEIESHVVFLKKWIYSFHMPLFFFISGYLFSLTNPDFLKINAGHFLFKKSQKVACSLLRARLTFPVHQHERGYGRASCRLATVVCLSSGIGLFMVHSHSLYRFRIRHLAERRRPQFQETRDGFMLHIRPVSRSIRRPTNIPAQSF